MKPTWIDQVYGWVIKRRNPTIQAFKVFYILQVILLFFGSLSIYRHDDNWAFFYQIGVWSGKIGLVVFILTSIPGIVRRFGKFNKLVSILMIFRRYLGIAMYMFALIHAGFVRFILSIDRPASLLHLAVFELFGVIASLLLFSLFITSNDLSVNKMGIWWHRVHNLMYVIVWVIFLHVVLQRFSIWTVLIGLTGIAQIASFVVSRSRKSAINASLTSDENK